MLEQLRSRASRLSFPRTFNESSSAWIAAVRRKFRKLRQEWSLVTVLTVAVAVLLVLVSLIPVWGIIWNHLVISWESDRGREPVNRVNDVRVLEQYTQFPLSDAALVNEEKIVVSSEGGGIHLARLDAPRNWGFWRTWDPTRTLGRLPEANIQQVVNDGLRLYFRGASGTLSSANEQLDDWRLLIGGGHFEPNLKLDGKVEALAICPNRDCFVVGTKEYGAAVYDVLNHEWLRLPNKGAVTHLLISGDLLWAGGPTGLTVHRIQREEDRLTLQRRLDLELPRDFKDHEVFFLGGPESQTIHCVVGRGAHLTLKLPDGPWRVVVDEGDDHLGEISGRRTLSSIVPTKDGGWLALSGVGPLYYSATQRRLDLRTKGISSSTEFMRLFMTPGSDGKSIFAVAGGESAGTLYRLQKDEWKPFGPNNVQVKDMAFLGTSPVLTVQDGRVILLDELGKTSSEFFAPLTAEFPLTAAEEGARMIFLADNKGDIHAYQPWLRSWNKFPGGGDRIAQLRLIDEALWFIRENGEAGRYETLANPQLRAVFAPSALADSAGRVLSAIFTGKALWFIRERTGSPSIYVYESMEKGIRDGNKGLPENFMPSRLRALETTLYVEGTEKGARSLYFRSADTDWQKLPIEGDLISWVAGNKLWAGINASSTLIVHAGKGNPVTFLQGRGFVRWRRLVADRFGRLWGVSEDGHLVYYQEHLGTWTDEAINDARDVVIAAQGAVDRLYVGTSGNSGIVILEATADSVKKISESLSAPPILRLAYDSNDLWALAGDDSGAESLLLWSGSKGESHRVWEARSDGPSGEQFSSAVWAGFIENSLWFVTSHGKIWKYEPERHAWEFTALPTEEPRHLQVARDGTVWWLDPAGTLNNFKNDASSRLGMAPLPDDKSQAWVEKLQFVGLWIGILVFVLVLIGFAPLLFEGGILRSVFRRWIPIVGSASLICFGAAFYIEQAKIEPAKAFAGKDFTRSVSNFYFVDKGRRLLIETAEGRWLFQVDGPNLLPDRHVRDKAGEDQPQESSSDGDWRVTRTGRGWILSHRRKKLGFQEVSFGAHGFQADILLGFGVHSGKLWVATPVGVGEYSAVEHPKLVQWEEANGQSAMQALPSRLGIDQGSLGQLRWRNSSMSSELVAPSFIKESGRFAADQALKVLVDRAGEVWVSTVAGWRLLKVRAESAELTHPVAQSPSDAPSEVRWQIKDAWSCQRSEGLRGDVVTFIPVMTGIHAPSNDPFVRGRWPEEDARRLIVHDQNYWINTSYGAWNLSGGKLRWTPQAVPDQPEGPRQFNVNFGKALAANAREDLTGTKAAVVLDDFSPEKRRFHRDVVDQVKAGDHDLWFKTNAGLQSADVHDGGLINQQSQLDSARVLSIERTPEGILFASDHNGVLAYEGGHWQPDNSDRNPFLHPRRGAMGQFLTYHRQLVSGQTEISLFTEAGQVGFEQGKLESDFIKAGVDTGEWTAAGWIAGRRLVPVPNQTVDYLTSTAAGSILARVGNKVYEYSEPRGHWKETQSDVFKLPFLSFDSREWQFNWVDAPRPEVKGTLNALGQFPSDHATGISTAAGEVRIQYEDRVRTYRSTSQILRPWLPEAVGQQPAASSPSRLLRWEGIVRQRHVIASVEGSTTILVEQENKIAQVSLSEPILYLTGNSRALWAITSKALYRIDEWLLAGSPRQAPVQPVEISVTVLFDSGLSSLSQQAREVLTQFAHEIQERNEMYWIDGYSDAIGGMQVNCRVSQMRAEGVRTELARLGVPTNRLRVRWFGAAFARRSHALDSTKTDRRVDVHLASEENQPVGSCPQ